MQKCGSGEGYKGEVHDSKSIYVTGRFDLLAEGRDESKGK